MTMDGNAKDIKPIGDRVLLKFVPVKKEETKTKHGLVLPGKDKVQPGQTYGGSMGEVYRAYIYAIGEKVNVDEVNFKVGDWVVFNNHDAMALDMPDPEDPTGVIHYGMTKPESIWGVYVE